MKRAVHVLQQQQFCRVMQVLAQPKRLQPLFDQRVRKRERARAVVRALQVFKVLAADVGDA